MSNITNLTQEFYKQRREVADTKNSQEVIEAHHVGWNSVVTQIQAFKIATNLSWINWQEIESVLDVGCGYGRLLEFLISEKFYQGKYCGIDIVPDFVEKAIQIYGSKPKNQFLIGDFLEQDLNHKKFDIIISLGGLGVNHDYPDQVGQKSVKYAQRLVSKAFHLAGLAISLYFPNADNIKPSDRKPRMAYYKSSEIKAMLLEACDKHCADITFLSYPDKENVKTIAQVKLSK